MKKKILLQIIGLLFISKLNAQFNKQWLIGVGGQYDKYSFSAKNFITSSAGSKNLNTKVTNIAFGLELGYYVAKNLSISYKGVYQNWDGNYVKTSSLLNGIMVEKMIPIHEIILLNIGVNPFYESISENLVWYQSTNKKTDNHGCIFTIGFSFVLDKNFVLGTHLFRKFNSYPDPATGSSSLSGISMSVKYIFKNNLFKKNYDN
jgi:hypothetical protein